MFWLCCVDVLAACQTGAAAAVAAARGFLPQLARCQTGCLLQWNVLFSLFGSALSFPFQGRAGALELEAVRSGGGEIRGKEERSGRRISGLSGEEHWLESDYKFCVAFG